MSDNEIIKALECCLDASPSTCKNCPLFNLTNSTMVCSKIAIKFALDLINRQKAGIERVKTAFENQISVSKYWKSKRDELVEENEWLQDTLETTKAEAYKEFVEKINAESEIVEIDREGDFVEAENKIYNTVANWCKATSNKLLKELVGEDNVV